MSDPTAPPTGTVTFLFTDIEGSTRLWQDEPEAMRVGLAEHDGVLREVVEKRHGVVFKHTGDGVVAVFSSAGDAVDAQGGLQGLPFRVRMGLHTGEAELREGDYFGSAVNRCARLMAVAHGGQIVLSDTTAALVRERADLVDLGEHRLRDFTQPERVSQVGSQSFPPLRSLTAVPGNLPAQLTSFVGRDDEVAQVTAALHRHRIVTITGPGGVGKTRLAIRVGAEVSSAYEHGVWLIELAPVLDPGALPYALASTLGVQPRPMVTVLESVQQYLAERAMLLVLDNCEHVLSAAGIVAESLTRVCPGISVLATSREALAVEGEQVWPLGSLTVETDAVDLFVERARAVRPTFEVHGDDVHAVGAICRQLDGIPLAIELAAARTVSLAPGDIADRLNERFRLLTGGRRTAVERHQTLRAAVDWSYELLDESTRAVFDRLCVFAGGFTLEAAEAAVADGLVERYEVLDAITSLVAKSMVVADVQSDGSYRYGLLETLRQYGQERLDASGMTDGVRARHAEYMADFSERATRGWRSPAEQQWRHRMAAELDNLRAASGWAVAHGDTDLATRLIAPWSDQAYFYAPWGLGAMADATLELPDVDRHPLLLGVVSTAARSAFLRGDLERTSRLAEHGASIADDPGRHVHGDVWQMAAIARLYLQDPAGIRRYVLEGLTTAERRGDPYGIAWVAAPAAAMITDDDPAARAFAERALAAIALGCGPQMRSYVLACCALAYFNSDPERATALLEEAILLDAEVGVSHASLHSFLFLTVLHADRHDVRSALETARTGIIACHDQNSIINLAYLVDYAAVALSGLGFHDLAAAFYAIVDAGVVLPTVMESSGWQTERRQRGRNLTLAALGRHAIDEKRSQVDTMNVASVVTYAVTEIDAILAEVDAALDG